MLVGEVGDWLAHFKTLEERMADAIDSVWPRCITPLHARKGSLALEDRITNYLVAALIKSKKVPGRIILQYSLLTETPGQKVTLSSKIDFVLTIGDDEDVYLACECKRLNVPYETGTRGLFSEYVDEGLMRFISGQYSNGLPLAMMLGYVMDAHVDEARQSLQKAMKDRSQSIRLKSTKDKTPITGRPVRFSTTHSLSRHDIEVTHTLLEWS